MQKSISMPSVLRAVVSLKKWSTEENELVSIFMEESVSNLQTISALVVAAGVCFLFLSFISSYFALLGLALMIPGAAILKED